MTRREKKEWEERLRLRLIALDKAIQQRKDTTYSKHVVESAQRFEQYLLTGDNIQPETGR